MTLAEVYSIIDKRIGVCHEDYEMLFFFKAKKVLRIIKRYYNIERIQISPSGSIYVTTDKEINQSAEEYHYFDNNMVIRISDHRSRHYSKNIKKNIILRTLPDSRNSPYNYNRY